MAEAFKPARLCHAVRGLLAVSPTPLRPVSFAARWATERLVNGPREVADPGTAWTFDVRQAELPLFDRFSPTQYGESHDAS